MTISRIVRVKRISGLVVAAALCLPAAFTAYAQSQKAPAVTAQSAANSTSPIPLDQLVTKTVHQAWVASGRDEDVFFNMVEQLAQLSSQNRGVTLPDTQEAGERFGDWIKQDARKDPDQLLYAVVDHAVRYIGRKQAAANSGATPPAK